MVFLPPSIECVENDIFRRRVIPALLRAFHLSESLQSAVIVIVAYVVLVLIFAVSC